jgi:O-antigen/teichoic acid export membrane protein
MIDPLRSLTSGRPLARSALWSFTGMVAPLVVGVVAIPLLIEGMGKERFGLLAIVWMGVGYFSLFDMGLGRAMTKLVAERLGQERTDDLGPLIWTALSLILCLGLIGAAVVLWGAGPLIRHVFNVAPPLQAEAINAFRVLAAGLPVVVLTTAFIGLLEAHQRFASIAAIRIPLGVLTFAAPLLTLQVTPSLAWTTAALLVARLASACAFFLVAVSARPELLGPQWPTKAHIRPLFSFGGWLTVTNIVGPLMVYFDRFLIGAVLTMTAVTYYVTPYEVMSRAQMIPQSIMAVLFPAMATAMAADRHRLALLYDKTTRIIFFVMLPVLATPFLLAPEALAIWLDPQFSAISTPVVQWLAVGGLINALARSPLTVLQSGGRPDLVAKAHLIELIPYALLLWVLTVNFGIVGTAAAWSFRVLADQVILNELARRTIPALTSSILGNYTKVAAIVLTASVAILVTPLAGRLFLLACIFIFALTQGWPLIRVFSSSERGRVSLI